MSYSKHAICNNCGKQGHTYNNCKMPITSYGVIVFRLSPDAPQELQYLMIRRKNTFGFVDFVRGKYAHHNLEHLQSMVDEMSMDERTQLHTQSFDTLWHNMWNVPAACNPFSGAALVADNTPPTFSSSFPPSSFPFSSSSSSFPSSSSSFPSSSSSFPSSSSSFPFSSSSSFPSSFPPSSSSSSSSTSVYTHEEMVSRKKFEQLKQGVHVVVGDSVEKVTLQTLMAKSATHWSEPEWEFPKGRRNSQEKDLDCALREFEEETGLSRSYIQVIENVVPFEEMFLGSNCKLYKHKYFVAKWVDCAETAAASAALLDNFQRSEVSKLEWKTLSNCLATIRPYHEEKKQIVGQVDAMLKQYAMCVVHPY